MDFLEDLARSKVDSATTFLMQDDAKTKLQNLTNAPIRQSALDKAKADAKARKLRDEAEAASVLEDFVKDFDADTNETEFVSSRGNTAIGRAGRRHFSTRQVCLFDNVDSGRGLYSPDREEEEFGYIFG
jgi:hypothetical protein